MSTIRSQIIPARINNAVPGGLYGVKLPTNIVTPNVNALGVVLISFRQSNVGADWMALPYSETNNSWVYSYGIDPTGAGYVYIVNNTGDMPNGVDFKIVTIEV